MAPEAEGVDAELSLSQCLEMVSRRSKTFAGVWALSLVPFLLYAVLASPVYEGAALIEIARPASDDGLRRGGMNSVEEEQYLRTELRRLKTDSLSRRVYDELHLERVEEFAQPRGLQKLQEAVKVAQVPRTYLASVRAWARDPRLAAAIANALTAKYVQEHAHNALFMARDILKTLQLGSSTRGEKRRIFDALPAVVENRMIQAAKERRLAVEADLADLSMRYTRRHPEVIAGSARLEALDRVIDRETENIVNSLKARLSGEFTPNNVRVLDPARVPEEPVKPNKVLLTALGLLGGFILGLFGVAIAESLDQSIRSEEDVARKLHEPFLGLVPRSRRGGEAEVLGEMQADDAALEAFRNLRTMVDFAGVDGRASPLLVTSSLHGEGKSLVAANLALAFSRAGERVLLIEGDLRRPRVHERFGLPAARGLCDFLAGKSLVDLAQEIRPAGPSNLSVLACGARPPNPSELLNTPRVAALVAWAGRAYDRVVVDCTPMFPVSDALLWGRQVRSAVFVTRWARTRAPLARAACGRLKAGGIKTLGVVINFARLGAMTQGADTYERWYRVPALR